MSRSDTPEKRHREEPESFFIADFSEKTKERFLAYLRNEAIILSSEEMRELDATGFTIAWITYTYHPNQFGVAIKRLGVFVNESAFLIGGEDNRDLIPLTIEHEATEGWTNIAERHRQRKRFLRNDSSRTGIGHQAGLRAEYELAHTLGLADRYLELNRQWAKLHPAHRRRSFWEENLAAYLKTKPENRTVGLR